MDSNIDPLDVLQNRITTLEEKVFGNKKSFDGAKPLADSVVDINNQLTSALAQRDSINALLKRLTELDKYLDPSYGEEVGLSAAAKLELVMAMEPELRQTLASLESLNKAQSALNSEHLRGVPQLQGKLEKLTIVYLDKKETLDAQTSQLRQLLKQYNDLVTTLSSTFVQWDQIVTDCELAAIPKKRLD